jgi:hypothetical protein
MATDAEERAEEPAGGGRDWQEVVVTVLLVVAALATSWSSYQATRWNGEQAKAASRTNAIRIDAARAQGLAEAQTQVDVATFIAWADADRRGERELADFYEARFRPEFGKAFEAWIVTNPFADPNAPRTPFVMPEYQVYAKQQAAQLDAEAEASAAEVRRDIQWAGNFVLTVVLYTVALFFAGMSTKLGHRRLRVVLLVCGYVTFLAAIAWVATFPVSLTI